MPRAYDSYVLLIVAVLLAVFVLPSPWSIGVVIAAACFEVVELSIWRRTLGWGKKTGVEALVGMSAEVVQDCDPSGRVRVRGELWNADSASPAEVGDTVVVQRVDGLRLEVAPGTEKGP
jgi:membrane-bound serine protease (ClpP class)